MNGATRRRNLANNISEGGKSAMSIRNFNLRRSQVRKRGRVVYFSPLTNIHSFPPTQPNLFATLKTHWPKKTNSSVEKVLDGAFGHHRHPFTPMGQYFLHTCSFTPWSSVLLEKLIGLQLVKKFPAFYGTGRFITAFTGAGNLSLS